MEITELKQRLNITEVAQALNIEIGKNQKALCPFHNDTVPSLQFSREKNICTCFSSNCAAGTMDIISLTEKRLNVNTHEALKWLTKLTGKIPGNGKNQQIKTEPPETLSRIAVLTKAFNYFKQASKSRSEQLRDYLQSRKLDPLKIEIGYNSGQLHHRKSEHLIKSYAKYNLLLPGKSPSKTGLSFTPWAKHCIIFALRDKNGKIVSLYGRSISNNGSMRHYYLKDRQGLYPKYPNPETKKLILTESIIDASTLLQLPEITKEHEILSLFGTNGLTDEHKQAIKELGKLNEIIFFLNGDEPGRESVRKYSKQLSVISNQLKISAVNTPEREDINSLFQSHEPEIFAHLLKERQFLFSIEKISTEEKKVEQASEPSPSAPTPQNQVKILNQKSTILNTNNPNKIIYKTETANYYVKGGLRKELDIMKVSIDIENKETWLKSRKKLDLYDDKQVEKISRESAEKLDLRADLIELDLNKLTDLLDEYRETELLTGQNNINMRNKKQVPPEKAKKCISFLIKPNLINRINDLIGKAGVVGEEKNRIFLFGIAGSYKMPDTLHALIQGSSGSGKTHLLRKIGNLIPPEDCIFLTRVTENSFYNYDEYYFHHKLVCFEDLDGLKEEAYFAVRELQSNEILTSSTSTKNEDGQIRGMLKVVRGPIASLSATTHGEIYEDNMSRIFLLSVDECNEQTQKIIEYKNKKAAGLIDANKEQQLTEFLQNCLRLLKPYEVVNPYGDKVLLPKKAHKIRRLTELYHAYVKQITLINQYQRKKDNQGRLISEKEDMLTACDIMFDSIVLKVDELDGSLRQFYEDLKSYIKQQGKEYQNYQFTQREVRQGLNISKTQLQRYINDLLELEYIYQTGGYVNKGLKYKIVYWDDIHALREEIKQYLKTQLDKL